VFILSGEGNIEALMRVAENCGTKDHAKQAIHSLRTTYVRVFHYNVQVFPSPDKLCNHHHCHLIANFVLCAAGELCVLSLFYWHVFTVLSFV